MVEIILGLTIAFIVTGFSCVFYAGWNAADNCK